MVCRNIENKTEQNRTEHIFYFRHSYHENKVNVNWILTIYLYRTLETILINNHTIGVVRRVNVKQTGSAACENLVYLFLKRNSDPEPSSVLDFVEQLGSG